MLALSHRTRSRYDGRHAGSRQLSDAELKEMIKQLTAEEREVSYQRRLLHGRIELLKSELMSRLQGPGRGRAVGRGRRRAQPRSSPGGCRTSTGWRAARATTSAEPDGAGHGACTAPSAGSIRARPTGTAGAAARC